MYQERNYVIFNVSELNKIDFNQVLETSADTVRKSVDGTKTFVKWGGDEPSCISELTTKEGPYTHEEILQILSTEEWTKPMDIEEI
jgi:hypothetical protein